MCVLTLRAALAELLAEVLSGDAGTGGVAGLPRVVTRLVVIDVVGRAVCMRRDAAVTHDVHRSIECDRLHTVNATVCEHIDLTAPRWPFCAALTKALMTEM